MAAKLVKSQRRFVARQNECPTCGAPAGVACQGAKGDERKSVHQARFAQVTQRAVAQAFKFSPSDPFYQSDEWRRVRYRALLKHGGKCQCCGARPTIRSPLHVDHIKPRSRFPELELDLKNLQVLCEDCNLGKGAGDTTDWRSCG